MALGTCSMECEVFDLRAHVYTWLLLVTGFVCSARGYRWLLLVTGFVCSARGYSRVHIYGFFGVLRQ